MLDENNKKQCVPLINIVFAPMNEYELHFGDFIQLFDVHVMISNNFSCY